MSKWLLPQTEFGEFLTAIASNDLNEAQRLFKIEYINSRLRSGETSLCAACRTGNLDIVRWLLDQGENIEKKGYDGRTPLCVACLNGHLDIVQWLLDQGANIDKKDDSEETPLCVACSNGHIDIVRCLLDRGANNLGNQSLLKACTNGHTDIVRFLIDRGANIDAKDQIGRTVLFFACGFGHTDTVRCLLDHGANVDCEDDFKYRPIHQAASSGHESVVAELISRKCVLTTTTILGRTPLETALIANKTECAKMLYEALKNRPPELLPSIDNYTKGKLLGRGGFGQVYVYSENQSERTFAIKEVPLQPSKVKSLEKEVDIFKMLPLHPNIVQYYGTMKDDQKMYIVMERIYGESLRDKLDQAWPLENLIATYSHQILEGLHFLHRYHIIHRDIKAKNILVDSKDYLKLCDFGVSRYLSLIENTSKTTADPDREMAGTEAGSSYYMAPEVINGDTHTIFADVWSLGATVFEMITGLPPNHELKEKEAKLKIAMTKKVEYKGQRPISDDLQSFLYSMLVADPEKRARVESLLNSTFILERKIIGKFDDRIRIKKLGRNVGEFTAVFKDFDKRINEHSCTKHFHGNIAYAIENNELTNNSDIYKTMSKHQNIVQYISLFVRDRIINIISTYFDGISIRDMLDKGKKVTITDCTKYTKQALEGLQYLHRNNIIHGNLKASNIIVNNNGSVKLSDYGVMMYLGRLFEDSEEKYKFDEYFLQHSFWMAPETIKDGQYTVCSDVWSMAVTIIEMLGGEPLYFYLKPKDVLMKIIAETNFKSEYPRPISEELHDLLDSILVSDPAERPLVESILNSDFITTNVIRMRKLSWSQGLMLLKND